MLATQPAMLLYVEDDRAQARLVQKTLERQGYLMEVAETGQQGLNSYDPQMHRVILLDYWMPDTDGLKVMQKLRSRFDNNLPPVIMLTGAGNEKIAVEALKMGAADYIIKDVDQTFLELLPSVIEGVLYTQDLVQQNKRQQEELSYYARELEKRNEVLKHFAYHDNMTGLANRVLFEIDIEKAMARARRNKKTMALLCIDLEGLYAINKAYGLLAGDTIIKEAADRLRSTVRDSDNLYRLGGAEFTIIAEGMENPKDASLVVDKVLEQFQRPFTLGKEQLPLQASAGIATFPNDGSSGQALHEHADAALRHARQQQGSHFAFYEATRLRPVINQKRA